MKNILNKILRDKKLEVSRLKKEIPLVKIKAKIKQTRIRPRDLKKSISVGKKPRCIGELKIASPSKGVLNRRLNLVKAARLYEKEGISAISVLTDRSFMGKLTDLRSVKAAVGLPVLRKDFIFEEYQIYESLLAGADAVLLIAAILDKRRLAEMLALSSKLRLQAIVEVHNKQDLKKIDFKQVEIVGINNRNLKNFAVDLKTTERLLKKIPRGLTVVSESGICSRNDMLLMKKIGVDAVLVGEGIVASGNIRKKIKELLGKNEDKD